MTREKLIFFGETFLKVNKDSKNTNIYEFVNEALKLLKREPCEDCISREAVIDMSDFIGEAPTYSHPYAKLKEVVYVEDIESLPFVKPVRKVGKWENGNPICPYCGEVLEEEVNNE